MKTLIGTKIGMTQILAEDGTMVPVTLISAEPNTVTQVKSVESDGYNAVQIGYGRGKNLSKAVAGHLEPSQETPKHLKEVRVKQLPELAVGDKLTVEVFAVGEMVDVTGTSKGKGWAGTIKRHNHHRPYAHTQPLSHTNSITEKGYLRSLFYY